MRHLVTRVMAIQGNHPMLAAQHLFASLELLLLFFVVIHHTIGLYE